MRFLSPLVCVLIGVPWLWIDAQGRPVQHTLEKTDEHVNPDLVGDLDGTVSHPRKAQLDTIWIADWSFDGASGGCDDTGWTRIDNRVRNDGQVFWDDDDARFDGIGGISGQAAVLGHHDPCWVIPEGYDNDWYQALVIKYTGTSSLSFDYLLDSEANWDFIRVEVDSACSSFDRVDFNVDPSKNASALRGAPLFAASGVDSSGHVDSIGLTDFGMPSETHCVYVAFVSDVSFSPADGLQGTALGAAVVVDNVQLSGDTQLTEDFEASGAMHPSLAFANIQDSQPFGEWARLFERVTDNDFCTQNTTCAWIFSDYTTPTIANQPTMAFGPGAYVVRNWLDDIIVSPWVSLSGTAGSLGTFLSWRILGANPFSGSRIVRNWSVRGRVEKDNTETPDPGDTVECVSAWGHALSWWFVNSFGWENWAQDMTPHFDRTVSDIQIRFRISDWQWIVGANPPALFVPGPGPYIDRVRIGRTILSGPAIIERAGGTAFQAQDAFPTEIDPFVTPAGEHYRATTDRFGTAAFSPAIDRGSSSTPPPSPNLITGDSIVVSVLDLRGAGGITRVDWYGAVVSGPHKGKAPPPWTVGTNGFFTVHAESTRVVENAWFVDLDDDYFRGGDVLQYFWLAEDAQGGISSDPPGLAGVPASLEQATLSTDGLFEVNFLPTIDWDPGYLARIAADSHGKLEPTEEEIAGSKQATCILYYQYVAPDRRSGDQNRTSFMYTLDRLGYRGYYDVYDVQGTGNDNNGLGGRATVEQAQGYALIVQDSGSRFGTTEKSPGTWLLSDGSELQRFKIDQVNWYRSWLANAASSKAGSATLWLIGSRLTEAALTNTANTLLTGDMGVSLAAPNIATPGGDLGANSDVAGTGAFVFASGSTAQFDNDTFTVLSGCPDFQAFNGIDASGTAVMTHHWTKDDIVGDGAIVMNANPSQSWNTIMQVPTWREIRAANSGPSSPDAEEQLLTTILNGVLPPECVQNPDPTTDVRDDTDELDALPKVTALYQNTPNPFNPMTTIRFDLARDSHVRLRIYNVAGRVVRTLVNGPMERERHQLVWDGLDDSGASVASGMYFYRLETTDFGDTRKMLVLR